MNFNFCSLLVVKKKKSPRVIIVNTLLCGHCNIWVGGDGGKVTIVHMSLASIQSSVQNVILFCKKRSMIFKINLVNLKKKKRDYETGLDIPVSIGIATPAYSFLKHDVLFLLPLDVA